MQQKERGSVLTAANRIDNSFCCGSCLKEIDANYGFKLQICSHKLCRTCLTKTITSNMGRFAVCPFDGCHGRILDEEIRCLLDVDQLKLYELLLV